MGQALLCDDVTAALPAEELIFFFIFLTNGFYFTVIRGCTSFFLYISCTFSPFVSGTGCLFLALTVARLFLEKKWKKKKKKKSETSGDETSECPTPSSSRPPSACHPTSLGLHLRATVGQNRPAGPGLLAWRCGDCDCSFFLFLSYCHPHNFAVFAHWTPRSGGG